MSNTVKTATIFWYIAGALLGSIILWELGYYADATIFSSYSDLEYIDPLLNMAENPDSAFEVLERTNQMNLYRLTIWLLVSLFHIPLIYIFARILKSKFDKQL
jgi:hypothetical protein